MKPGQTRYDIVAGGKWVLVVLSVPFLGLTAFAASTSEWGGAAAYLAVIPVSYLIGLAFERGVFYVIIDAEQVHIRQYRTGAAVKWDQFDRVEIGPQEGEIRVYYRPYWNQGDTTSYCIYESFWPKNPDAVLKAIQAAAADYAPRAHLTATSP